MADVNLSIGSSNVDKSYSGTHSNQVIHFYCSYNSSGTVTIRCNVSVTSYNFNTSQGAGYITIDGTTTNRTTGTFEVSKNSNKDFLTATKSITTAKTFTVTAKMNAYAGGWGPVPSGGRTFSFTVYVPGIVTSCGAPTSLSINKSRAAPSEKAVLSWSGASGGTVNSIQRYYTEYTTNGGSSWAATSPYNAYTSSGSSNLEITLPSIEGATLGFRVRTEGAAGSGYYSGYKTVYNMCTLYSRPTMGACSASQSLGTYTITWSAATAGTNNSVSAYEIWYSYKTSSSGSWSTRTHIANVSSSSRSYTWSGGTVGYYYRFSVVALGTNYSYSATTDTWSAGYKKDYAYTACGAPSNLKSNNTNPTIGQSITLSWTAGSAGTNNSVTGYELYYSTNAGSTYTLISSSIGASTTSYSYTVPRTPGEIRFRIRTKGSAGTSYYSGYNYSSAYQTITIKQANPPTAGTVTATLINSGSSGGKAFSISWAGFAGNTYNPISGYSLYYKSSKTIDDSDFSTNMTAISTSLGASTTSYTWTGGNWNYYYKFYVKAKGQYYGESSYAESTAVLKETEDSTPPTNILYRGSGYIKYRGKNYAIPGLKIEAMPIGASNANYYTVEYREVKENGTATAWRVIANDMSLNKYTSSVTISKNLVNGDYIEFRAKSKNIAGEYSEYFPSDSDLYDYRISVKRFKKENELHPRIQIKRAHTGAWTRESSDSEGIRIFDGELAYDTEKRVLKIGNYTDNTPKKFDELSNMFGLLEVGTDNRITAINSAAVGIGNICEERKGYAILGVTGGTTVTLSTVEGLSAGMTVKYSYTGSTYSVTIVSVNSSNSTIVTNSNVSYYDYGSHTMSHGALWVESDASKGDIIIDIYSGLLIGSNNSNMGIRNLISGDSNSITKPYSSQSYNNIIVGASNTVSSYMYNSAVFGYGNKISYCSYSLIQGSSNTITSGSYMLVSGYNNTTSGSYNLIGYYLTGGGDSYGLTIGKYNTPISQSLFVIGNGTSTSDKSNAFYITKGVAQFNTTLTCGSTLYVNGHTTLASTSSHSGLATFSTLKCTNAANFNSSLSVNGASGLYFKTSEKGTQVGNIWASGSGVSMNGDYSNSSGSLTFKNITATSYLYLPYGSYNSYFYGSNRSFSGDGASRNCIAGLTQLYYFNDETEVAGDFWCSGDMMTRGAIHLYGTQKTLQFWTGSNKNSPGVLKASFYQDGSRMLCGTWGNNNFEFFGFPSIYGNFVNSSDINKKSSIIPYENKNIDKLKKLKFYSYDIDIDTENGEEIKRQILFSQSMNLEVSVVAQKLQKMIDEDKPILQHVPIGIMAQEAPPEIIADDGKGINLYQYINFCAKAIQEQQIEIEELKQKLASQSSSL